ncbi:hypothetical protein INT43_000014 [Umbelopsis isabellina]|uniref:RNA polymerase II degradation factor 1 n=1 Tax=Mortierella isabellina TaxID=91625 RepID=A0A8H7PEW2_MORIS|nr:hypothetical protein INT43_000014 [Umbelopsis isabellina]
MTTAAARPKSQQSSRGNDLKKLRAQYGTQLSTLRELFSDWSDEDLLFALQEADGDVELTAVRISEGWANQWGEVKGKKSKKETVQKQKSTSPESQRQQKTDRGANSSRGGFGGRGRGGSRGGRPANFGDRGRGGKSGKSSRNDRPLSELPNNTTDDSNATWQNTVVDSAKNGERSSPAPTQPAGPPSWASLLKSQPVPEPVKEPVPEVSEEKPNSEEVSEEKPNSEETVVSVEVKENVTPETVAAEQGLEKASPQDSVVHKTPEVAKPVEPVVETVPATSRNRMSMGRRLKQDVPVVLPGGNTTLGAVGVRFGNLNLDQDEQETEVKESEDSVNILGSHEPETESLANSSQLANDNSSVLPSVQGNQVYNDNRLPQSEIVDHNNVFSQGLNGSYIKLDPQSVQQQPHQQQPHHQQQQQQQQHTGHGDQQGTPYSYLPNQQLTGLTGYGMSPMASVPDYAMYTSEAQRAATMGYYDPAAALHPSPSNPPASAYQGREKYNHDNQAAQANTPTTTGNPNLQGQQHAYANIPYYPYYYMPNQFQGYQQPGYGQPYMNKNMYPMYQHTNKPTANSPYAANASPYQHHYSPAASYEDMSTLQQHGMIQDYSKPYGNAPQLPNYMAGQQGQASGNQPANKNETNGQYGKNVNNSQGQAQYMSQQSNAYGQMYSAYQQQQQHQHQHQQQQYSQQHRQPQPQGQGQVQPQSQPQVQGAQAPSQTGNQQQQPYWSQ